MENKNLSEKDSFLVFTIMDLEENIKDTEKRVADLKTKLSYFKDTEEEPTIDLSKQYRNFTPEEMVLAKYFTEHNNFSALHGMRKMAKKREE